MEYVKNNVKLIDLAEPGRKIEYAGRVCYKSQDKISEDSYEKFIKGIVSRGHTSVLEHERKMFAIPAELYFEENFEELFQYQKFFNITITDDYIFISGNIRAWYDFINSWDSFNYKETQALSNLLNKDYPYLFKTYSNTFKGILYGVEAEELAEKICNSYDLQKHKSYTFEIVGSRSFTHQLVRHRTLSFSQESQRYCNYSGNKFNHSVKFIKCDAFEDDILQTIEDAYFKAIDNGAKPEDARQILPNCTATTIVVTGTLEDWVKFLFLRLDPHAQKEIREIAETILSYLPLTRKNAGYV